MEIFEKPELNREYTFLSLSHFNIEYVNYIIFSSICFWISVLKTR